MYKSLISLVILTLVTVNCGPSTYKRTVVQTGSSCSVEQTDTGAVVSCSDGSSAVINNGQDGQDGIDGSHCDVEDTDNGAIITCEDDSVIINDGKDGKVKTVNPEPIYEGYFCSRTVVRIGKEMYVINSGLVVLTKEWYSIGSCKIRYNNKQIEVD